MTNLKTVLPSKAIFREKMWLNFVFNNFPTMSRREPAHFLHLHLVLREKVVVDLQTHHRKKEAKENQVEDQDQLNLLVLLQV